MCGEGGGGLGDVDGVNWKELVRAGWWRWDERGGAGGWTDILEGEGDICRSLGERALCDRNNI